jgi:hypothetical protein
VTTPRSDFDPPPPSCTCVRTRPADSVGPEEWDICPECLREEAAEERREQERRALMGIGRGDALRSEA